MTDYHAIEIEEQISQCLSLLNDVLGQDLLGVYLYGSLIVGGLQKYSDIDIFVVTDRPTTHEERAKLVANILQISGVYQNSSKPPIEMTIVVKSEINPWHYPPKFDFQYGDWLRTEFEGGNIEPWPTNEMPDLAVLITQLLLANKILLGPSLDQLLCKIPYRDFLAATKAALEPLMSELHSDTRNVLLTYARIWKTVKTDAISTKPDAAAWAIDYLPEEYQSVMRRACAICIGAEKEYWDDVKTLIQPCADYMVREINKSISSCESSDTLKSIKLAE